MLLTITFIELKSPLNYFELSLNAMRILKQLKSTNCIAVKTTGFWKKHYTMTLWNSSEEMKNFAKSGAHKEAMKISSKLANELRTLTIEAVSIPEWDYAKNKIHSEGKVLNLR